MKTFWIRTASAIVYAVLFLGTLLSGRLLNNPKLGLVLFGAFLLFVTVGCTYEFFRMVKTQGSKACEPLAVVYCLLSFVTVGIPSIMSALNGFKVMLWAFILFPCVVALIAIVQLWAKSDQSSSDVAYTKVPKLYIVIPMSFLCLLALVAAFAPPIIYAPFNGFMVMLSAFILFPCVFALAAIVQLWTKSNQPFRDAAYTMVPMLYIALPLSLMLALVPDAGARVVLMLVLMVWLNDSGAYIGGSLFGKHKMWERHSPGKTWEGTAFGVLVTVLVAVFVGPWIQPAVAWYHWLALGLICSVIDTLGDLVESMLKRSVGMKDSGNIMPGHGGFLDRFDSLLIIMPFAFAYINLIIF